MIEFVAVWKPFFVLDVALLNSFPGTFRDSLPQMGAHLKKIDDALHIPYGRHFNSKAATLQLLEKVVSIAIHNYINMKRLERNFISKQSPISESFLIFAGSRNFMWLCLQLIVRPKFCEFFRNTERKMRDSELSVWVPMRILVAQVTDHCQKKMKQKGHLGPKFSHRQQSA